MASELGYAKTPIGQLLYDLAFTEITDKWIARKHRISLSEVRTLRGSRGIKRLARQVRKDRQARRSGGKDGEY
jgi:hypothetical protein